MPIYEYRCQACGHCFEVLVVSRNDEEILCPQCGRDEVNKLMSCINAFGGAKAGGACSSGSSSGFS